MGGYGGVCASVHGRYTGRALGKLLMGELSVYATVHLHIVLVVGASNGPTLCELGPATKNVVSRVRDRVPMT